MLRIYKILFISAAVVSVGLAQAQTSGTGQSSTTSSMTGTATDQSSGQAGKNDPFVERRDEKAKARKEYKSNKITKDQYKAERRAENQKLKSTGVRSDTEKNQDVQLPGGR